MRKSTWIAAIATTLILAVTAPASAAINVQLNGRPLTFDVPPVIENGRTLVPVRTIFEALGARITWDPASRTVSAVHPELDRYVILPLDSMTAWIDGKEVTLEVPAQIVNERTMVPLRFISTAMGAEVTFDAATRTALIEQKLAAPAEEQPASGPSDEEARANAQMLSRFTRNVARTQLEETWNCNVGMNNRFDEMGYVFSTGENELLAEWAPYLGETGLCWDLYEQNILAKLPAPVGAEAAREALQQWVDLNQNALEQLSLALSAHRKGETAARDRLFQEGQKLLQAAAEQEQKMLAAMSAITSDDPEFLTVAEHSYVAWLDDMMGATDNCFSQLGMIDEFPGEEARWARGAADCMVEMPTALREEKPPTPRMQALLDAALAEIARQAQGFSALAVKVEAGPVDSEVLRAEIDRIWEAWNEALPTLEGLFVYRDYGRVDGEE